MGVTARASALTALCLAGAWGCGGERLADRAEPEVLVVEDPVTVVVSGTDTTLVYVPTVFSYADADLFEEASSPSDAGRIVAFRESSESALRSLGPHGVRFVHVGSPPALVQRPPDAPGGELDALPTGSTGYLLVQPSGRARWIEGTVEAAALVCAAASLFDLGVSGC